MFGVAEFEAGGAEDCSWRWPGQYEVYMSRFGPGNFDGDMESEYLQGIVDGLIRRVREIFSEARLMEPDEVESIEMLGGLDIVRCLARHLGHSSRVEKRRDCIFELPTPAEIAAWRTGYLAAWDGWMARVGASEDDRRAAIESTFDDLYELATSFRSGHDS